MALLFKDLNKLSAYRDRRFPGNQEEFELALKNSITVYVGNMSFYTTEEQVYELFSRVGEIKKITMGLDKNSKTPCGFCFILYYSRQDTEDAVKYISGTILDDRPIRVDFDWGFQEGRQWGRGRSGGQVRDEYRTDYDPDILFYHYTFMSLYLSDAPTILIFFSLTHYVTSTLHVALVSLVSHLTPQHIIHLALHFRPKTCHIVFVGGGYGKLVQRELEAQRTLVDYGAGSLGAFQPVMTPNYGRHERSRGHGGSYNRQGQGRDYQRKRHREDDRHPTEISKRTDREPRGNPDHESRPEKNPRFRERGDSDEEEDERKHRS
ncbi:hypothetical protein KSS87_019805 [Heliosperma pusillum]|nr:hypothetical protein KSS87_019805 [Heliosperma pusillum]